jgi:hypothetical protein
MEPNQPQPFEVQIRVRPTREHPDFFEIAFGVLLVWVFDTADEKSAIAKVRGILEFLPYEQGDCRCIKITDEIMKQCDPEIVKGIAHARKVGFSSGMASWPVGTNEKETLHDWPLLVPYLKKE